MRISDWSSDVCSSDLAWAGPYTKVGKGANGWGYLQHVPEHEPDQRQPRQKADRPQYDARSGANGGKGAARFFLIIIHLSDSSGAGGKVKPVAPPVSLRHRAGPPYAADRKSVVYGQSVSVRVDLGGRRIIQTKKETGHRVTTNTTHSVNKKSNNK